MGFAMGTADEMEKDVELVRSIESKIIDFYAEKTGHTKNDLNAWMEEEKFMTAEEALDLGFITDIAEELKMAAVFLIPKNKQSNLTEMSDEHKTFLEKANDILSRVQKVFEKEPKDVVANLNLNTKDGGQIEIVTTQLIPNVSDKVMIDGKPAPDAEYELIDGTKITVTGGLVATVTDPEGNKDSETVVAEVKLIDQKVVDDLKAENDSLKVQFEEIKTAQAVLLSTVEMIAENIESDYKVKGKKNVFNTKKEEDDDDKLTPAQKALKIKAEAKEKEK
jgi:hypothetical protein